MGGAFIGIAKQLMKRASQERGRELAVNAVGFREG